jgi:hypothetical protein
MGETKRLYKEIFGVVKTQDGENGYWTRIGTAFPNRDGSLNLKFNYLPVSMGTTIQVRDPKPRDAEMSDIDPNEVL